MTTTPQAALLSEAAKLADEFRVTMPREVFAIWGAEVQAELRRLDALVAHLTADRDDTANELALRTKHNIALTNERDQLLAKLQATQEPVHAGELLLQGGLTNEQLREAFGEKMPGVVPSDRDLTLFALGIEVGAAELADERRMKKMYFDERNSARDAWRRAADQREEARAALSARKPLTDETFVAACNGCPTPGKCKDTSGCASAGMNVPTYYVRHPDDTYTAADPQPRFNGIGLEVKP